MISSIQPFACSQRDMVDDELRERRQVGAEAPNRLSNCGITNSSRITVTMTATASTAAG